MFCDYCTQTSSTNEFGRSWLVGPEECFNEPDPDPEPCADNATLLLIGQDVCYDLINPDGNATVFHIFP